MIHAFITTRLDYCNSLYYGVNSSSIGHLQLVQNAAVRLLTRSKKIDCITPILISLRWLPVQFRIEFKILVFVYKSLHGLAPGYLSVLVLPHNPTQSLRSGDLGLLSVCRTKLKHRGDRAFARVGPKLWNSLPLSIRTVPSLSMFKSKLKSYFLSMAFNNICIFTVCILLS